MSAMATRIRVAVPLMDLDLIEVTRVVVVDRRPRKRAQALRLPARLPPLPELRERGGRKSGSRVGAARRAMDQLVLRLPLVGTRHGCPFPAVIDPAGRDACDGRFPVVSSAVESFTNTAIARCRPPGVTRRCRWWRVSCRCIVGRSCESRRALRRLSSGEWDQAQPRPQTRRETSWPIAFTVRLLRAASKSFRFASAVIPVAMTAHRGRNWRTHSDAEVPRRTR